MVAQERGVTDAPSTGGARYRAEVTFDEVFKDGLEFAKWVNVLCIAVASEFSFRR